MDVRIQLLLRIIDECGGTLGMTFSEIGTLLGLGEARLRRLFRMEVGKPLRRHLLEVRMERAALLLKNVATPIKIVAFHCGYTLINNFYRDFKLVHGTSPKQMRLRHMSVELYDKKSASIKCPPLGHSGAADSDQAASLHLVATS